MRYCSLVGVNGSYVKGYNKITMLEGGGCADGLSCEVGRYLNVYKLRNCRQTTDNYVVYQLNEPMLINSTLGGPWNVSYGPVLMASLLLAG
jgi:hypothetical protein